jgi:Skp family chaperone for outer membrane proteins
MNTSNETRDGIGQVREILVGAVQRDLERRITKLETNVGARVSELQQETRRRIDVLEGHVRTELDALSARVDGEIVELKDGLRAITREQRESTSASQQRVAKLEENGVHVQHDLRSQLLDQAKSFIDELHQMRDQFAETMERELASFETEGTDKSIPREQRDATESAAAR